MSSPQTNIEQPYSFEPRQAVKAESDPRFDSFVGRRFEEAPEGWVVDQTPTTEQSLLEKIPNSDQSQADRYDAAWGDQWGIVTVPDSAVQVLVTHEQVLHPQTSFVKKLARRLFKQL